MSGLESFLRQNRHTQPNEFYPASNDITDDEGVVVMWELKHLTTAECDAIKSSCIREVEDKRGIVGERLDTSLYMDRLVAASVVYPDLRSATLQDSYGVYTPEDLLKAILSKPMEYAALSDHVYGMLGFTTFSQKVDEAKN